MRFLFVVLLVLLCPPLHAQDAPTLAFTQIAAAIKPLAHKTVIFVFDVTQSTRHGGVFTGERAATATLLRQGCAPGDRVILLKFGTDYATVFDKTLAHTADIDPLINQIPIAPEPGRGTNIRWPHHEALKMIAAANLCPAIVVLLTDSFNDRPDLTDPNNAKYLAYYTLQSLTTYPDTPENRDYVRLLDSLTRKGCLHQYGVGVRLAPDGRPIERLPVGPGQGDSDSGTTTEAPTIFVSNGKKRSASLVPWQMGGLALLLILFFLWVFLSRRPLSLRLQVGDKGLPRDFRIGAGRQIALGGAPETASGSQDIFPLSGLATPAAFVQNSRGGLHLSPAPLHTDAPTFFHNGLPLQQSVPLRVGDELRVSLPATDAAPAREHRLRVEDPRGPVF